MTGQQESYNPKVVLHRVVFASIFPPVLLGFVVLLALVTVVNEVKGMFERASNWNRT